MSSHCEMLSVADESGTLFAHYHTPPVDESAKFRIRGPLIEYLNPRQLANFTRNGLVTEISEDEVPQQRRTLPEPVAPPPSPRYRMTGRADALWVTDSDGKQHMHIFDPVVAGSTHGALGAGIEWIERGQRDAYLLEGWIVEVDTADRPVDVVEEPEVLTGDWTDQVRDSSGRSLSQIISEATGIGSPADPEPVDLDAQDDDDDELSGSVTECLAELARLDIPLDSGRPTCAKTLRDNGIRYSNEVLAETVKRRRASVALSGTAS